MITKLLSLAVALPFGAAQVSDGASDQEFVLGPGSSCPGSIPLSCRNTTVQRNLCCFEAPGVSATPNEHVDRGTDSWTRRV